MHIVNGKKVISEVNAIGDISGLTPDIVSAGNITLTKEQCKGQILYMTGEGTVSLPRVTGDGLALTIYQTGAFAVHGDPDDNDRIVLDGVALDDGDKITSASEAGNFIVLHNDTADGWRTLGRSGAWTDGS